MQKISLIHCCACDTSVRQQQTRILQAQSSAEEIHSLEALLGADIIEHHFQYSGDVSKELGNKLANNTLIFLLVDEDSNSNNAVILSLITDVREISQADLFVLALPKSSLKSDLAYYAGADQFMKFPFNVSELNACTYALIKRQKRKIVKPFNCCGLVLTPAQSIIFHYLIEHQGNVISKQELQQVVLHQEHHIHDRNVDMHISNIRQKLLQAGYQKSLIKTVRNQGYIFKDPNSSLVPANKAQHQIEIQS